MTPVTIYLTTLSLALNTDNKLSKNTIHLKICTFYYLVRLKEIKCDTENKCGP